MTTAYPQIETKESLTLSKIIMNFLITIGIPVRQKGYKFLREAIEIAIEKPNYINNLTRLLYPAVAVKFDTKASAVERSIRHAIDTAWNGDKIININTIFNINIYNPKEKLTNNDFIALFAEKLLLEINN